MEIGGAALRVSKRVSNRSYVGRFIGTVELDADIKPAGLNGWEFRFVERLLLHMVMRVTKVLLHFVHSAASGHGPSVDADDRLGCIAIYRTDIPCHSKLHEQYAEKCDKRRCKA
jgi:hypothetical protein